MSLLRATVRDDRGHAVGLIEPSRTSLDPESRRTLPPLIRSEMLQRRMRRLVPWAFALMAGTGLLRVFVFGATSPMGLFYVNPIPIALGFVVPMFFYALINSNFSGYPKHRAKIQQAATGVGKCATCLYHLEAIPAEADGCTVCPECGSAWKLPAPVNE